MNLLAAEYDISDAESLREGLSGKEPVDGITARAEGEGARRS